MKLVLDNTLAQSNFTRRGNDLVYTHKITLEAALTSVPIKFVTLDNIHLNINMDQVITPQTVHCIPGEGMPLCTGTDPKDILNHLKPTQVLPRGDLYIKFDIQFPTNISIEHKNQVVELLRKNKLETK